MDRPVVDYAGNCGNLTAAVGPFAVDEGFVEVPDAPSTVLVLRNLNTGVRIRATVPLTGRGRAAWRGDTVIDGVPGSGAPIVTEYLDPAGSVTGKLFPTGSAIDAICGHEVTVARRHDPLRVRAGGGFRTLRRGVAGRPERPAGPAGGARAVARRLRGGHRRDERGGASPGPPGHGRTPPAIEVRVLATSMQRVHHAIPITGALCTAAALRLPGTVAADLAAAGRDAAASGSGVVRIGHPKGVVEATVDIDAEAGDVRAVGVVRTARRLLAGTAYVPAGRS